MNAVKLATAQGSAWASWSAADLTREIQARMNHFCRQTDGTMRFPSSAEGDLLKMVHALLAKPNNKVTQ